MKLKTSFIMPVSKFVLYKREWLTLVFKDRNQQYGAYVLRGHYANVLAASMAVTFLFVAAFGIVSTIISRSKEIIPMEKYHIVPVDNTVHIIPPKPLVQKQQKTEPAKPAPKTIPVAAQRYIVMRAEVDNKAQDPKPLDPNMTVGQTDVKGPATAAINAPPNDLVEGVPEGRGEAPPDNGIHGIDDLQLMPEPVGGANAWAKFLQKNLRYPSAAQEQGVQGRVYMSFIIEKDGHLSDITILRKAGYGFDEESLRVLKLAPAWKPGVQNGHPVRVKYTIPINFQMTD